MVPPPSRPTHSQSRSGTFSPIPLPTQAGGLSSAGSPITGSPTSGHRFDKSIAVTQIYVLLNLLRDNNKDRVKWELQADQLKKLIDDHGMEVFPRYFARLVAQNAGAIFQGSNRSNANSGDYALLAAEMEKISHNPDQAGKIAESIETGTDNVFRNFDLSTFMEHFKLDALEKTILALAFKFGSDPNLKTKADAILSTNFPTFMNIIARSDLPTHADLDSDFIALIVDRYVQGHPPNFNSSAKQELAHKVQSRWLTSNELTSTSPPLEVLASLDLMRLLGDKPANALTRYIQRVGADLTRSEESCHGYLDNRPDNIELSAEQVSSALLYTTISQTPRHDPSALVAGLRRVLPASFVWTTVLSYFDHRDVRVSSEQFLRLYEALLPIAQAQPQPNPAAPFDIQSLWGGSHWENPETQLAFICAFASLTPQQLDATTIPGLQTTFSLDEYDTSPQEVRDRAAEAIKHPLVSVYALSAIFQVALHSLHASQSNEAKRLFQHVVIPNLDVFLVSAFGVPKPWPSMAMETMGSLFSEFLLKQNPLTPFVMDSLWRKDKNWVMERLFEAHALSPMDLPIIFGHAIKHGWLDDLVYLSNGFGYDLAALAHAEGYLDIQEWMNVNTRQADNVARSLLQFLHIKAELEMRFQRPPDGQPPRKETWPLQVKTVSALLQILEDFMPRSPLPELIMVQRMCIIAYPRLINYGEGCDDIIDANGAAGNALPPQAVARMEEHFKTMYSSDIQVKDIVDTLLRYKHSRDPLDQDVFACMIHGLFDEYSHFPDYPLEALATTAVLFGGIISRKLISELPLKIGLGMILEAVKENARADSMYKFGLQALLQLLGRFREWPGFCRELLQIPQLQDTEAWSKAMEVVKDSEDESAQTQNGGGSGSHAGSEKVNGTPSAVEGSLPPFASVHADEAPSEARFETPNETIQDTIQFGLNNLTASKLQGVFADVRQILEYRYQQWFASHLVEERAKMQPNYHQVYLDFVRLFQDKSLSAEVLRQTYVSVARMINSESTMQNSTERTHLKNLGAWLGLLTIARDQPIKHRNIAFKQLLVEAYDTKRLIVVIPFVCKVLIQGVRSTVYRPPNPWLMDILHLLIELYHNGDLKLNLKFEIEVLCKDLNLDHKSIDPSQELSQHRAQIEEVADIVPNDALEQPFETHPMNGVSGAPGLSPHPVPVAIPDLTAQITIPPSNEMVVSASRLLEIVRQALTQALRDIITPVVDRSVTIAAISTAQMIHKDFATEADEKRIRDSATTMVKATAGSLALVTSKEPLRANITNYMRQLSSELQQPLPEGTIIMCVTSNLDLACSVIEKHAEERAVPEIEDMIEQELDARRRHRMQRPNEPYLDPNLSRWAMTIPNPYKLAPNMGGLNQEQLAIYEEFGRQSRALAPATQAHAASASDATRNIANEVLQDQYSVVPPNVSTPGETPSMPPHMPAQVPYPHVQHTPMANGRPAVAPINQVDARALAERVQKLLSELQRAAAEAHEDHFSDLPRNHPVMEAIDALTQLIIRTSQTSEEFAIFAAEKITQTLFNTVDNNSLILESLVHVLESLLKIYGGGVALIERVQALVDHQPLQSFMNISLVTALISTDLLNLQLVDEAAKAALMQRKDNALEFFERLWDLTLGSERPIALYGDFIGSLPQAWHWITAEPELEISRRLKAKILSSGVLPPGHLVQNSQLDQYEYLFEEWIRQYFNHSTPDKAASSFVRQLLERGAITNKDDLMIFLRRALEMAISYHEQTTLAGIVHDSFNAIDALVSLVGVLAQVNFMQANDPARGAVVVFDAVFMLGSLVLNHHHTQRGEHFNARAFYRFFAMLICEAHRSLDQLVSSGMVSPADVDVQRRELLLRVGDTFVQIVPERFPGFAFHWLELIQHRLFMPELLTPKPTRGWATVMQLLVALLRNVSEHLKVTDMHEVAKEYVRAATKLIVILQHDYPDFLAGHHAELCAHIPPHATQIRNIILSATPRGEELTEAHMIPYNNAEAYLEENGLLDLVDQLLQHGPSEDAVAHLTHAIQRNEARPTIFANVPITTNTSLVNAVVLHIGTSAVNRAKQDSDLFNPRSSDVATLSLLARELNAESRYFFLTSVIDELRFTGPHSNYFSQFLFELWGQDVSDPEELDIRQQIARILLERFSGFWPQPWSLVYATLDLLRNEKYMFFDQPFIKADREVRDRFQSIFRSIENM